MLHYVSVYCCICACRQVKRPNQAIPIKFKVGDVIRHARYHYRGVIYGWDPECTADEEWMQQMRIDSLPGMQTYAFSQHTMLCNLA